ncbi:uncharacterized protein LOC108910391 [Anoplophora glabripennis]|uniref:uncharacterized protein LOC108910391 n=1 Tax=Anoplophora glabripennis TaxID=217634 RepID=UPI0008745AF0|nr:uncharacterized protein LOC108910391 [Anoplophora glabripennis]
MATICFRPPPLPPNKKSSSIFTNVGRQRAKQNHGLLSSTYLSFRDPIDDDVEEIELANLKRDAGVGDGLRRCRRVSHTNSLCRNKDAKAVMTRSHSDGNLDKKGSSTLSLNRYMKVLSGSWRNLLNRKLPKPTKTDEVGAL